MPVHEALTLRAACAAPVTRNQSQFGRQVGLSQERISAIESHPEKITTDQLLTILMAMGMELVIKPRTSESASPGTW